MTSGVYGFDEGFPELSRHAIAAIFALRARAASVHCSYFIHPENEPAQTRG